MAGQNAKATTFLVKDNGVVKVHTLVSPADMFANATHIIELPTQLIVVDGHFFAQYASELKELAHSLGKPVSRIYISHDHPDHYLGFGDAFPDADVYALKEIKEAIQQNGPKELAEKQSHFGAAIASKLNYPRYVVDPGTEIVDGEIFIFSKVLNAESPVTLTISLPNLGVYIAQDIVYNNIHLFITGPTNGWRKALYNILNAGGYDIILAGHGNPTDKSGVKNAIAYLDKVDEILNEVQTPEAYKARLLAAFPDYAGAVLIDIYLPYLFSKNG
jgi:glyoxylase-like metal-dependent hydrolase (beta-lactamase superfamily II)